MIKKITISEFMMLSEEDSKAYLKSFEIENEKQIEKERQRTIKTMERAVVNLWVSHTRTEGEVKNG